MASVVIPEVKYDERIQEGAAELYREWRSERDEQYPQSPLINLRFEHDPFWRERVFSIQGAREMRHPVWKVVGALFFAGSLSGYWTLSLGR